MTDPRILETEIGTPIPLRASAGRQGLPEDLLRDASRRLGIVGLVSAGLWSAEIVLLHLATSMPSLVPPDQAYLLPKSLTVYDGVAITNILVSVGSSGTPATAAGARPSCWISAWGTRCSSRRAAWSTATSSRPTFTWAAWGSTSTS
ncbi:MAG: hypothetical protein ACREMG_14080 [Gemmatimonadales bacterium]